jgi:MFS family permease
MSKNLTNLIFYSFISSVSWAIYKVVFNLFLRDIGFGNDFIGQITSIEMVGSAIIGIIIGVMGDRFGKKKMLFISSIGFGLLLIARISFPTEQVLYTLSFFSGGFMTSRMLLLNSYIVDITEHSVRGKAFGFNFGLMMGSGVFGNFVGGFMGEFIGLRTTLFIAAFAYVLSIGLISKVPESIGDKDRTLKEIFDISEFTSDQKEIVKYYFLRTFSISFGAGLFVNFGNLIFKDMFELNPAMIGIALSIAQFGAALGSILSPKLGKKFGPFKYMKTLSLIVVPLIISLGFVGDPYVFTTLYAVRFSFMNMTNPVGMNIVLSSMPKDKVTTINSIRNSLNFVSRAVAAIMFGIIVALPSGYTYLFLIASIFYFIGYLMLKKMFKPIQKGKILHELYGNNG